MNITLDKSGPADGLLTVTLSEADYRPGVNKKIKEYIRKATIKGFRKGKAPHGVVQKMYGVPILVEEVNTLVSRSISQYIEESKLKIIGKPLPNKQKIDAVHWDTQKEFSFEFQIGLVDDFKYKLSPKIKLKSYSIQVGDDTVEETIYNLQKQFGEATYPEISEKTDHLQGELVVGTAEKSTINLAIAQLKEEEQEKFIGKKKGEQVTFDINTVFASTEDKANFLRAHPAIIPQKGIDVLTISTISRIAAAPLSQGLFDRVFGKDTVQSEEEFRLKVKDSISKQYQQETNRLLEHHIQRYFLENTKMAMPEVFLKTWLRQEGNETMQEEELERAVSTQKNILKWDLIKSKIAHDLTITISPEDVKKRARALIGEQYRGVDAQLNEKLDAFTAHYLSDQEGANFTKLKTQLQNERILGAIKEAVTLVQTPVSLADFKKIVERDTH